MLYNINLSHLIVIVFDLEIQETDLLRPEATIQITELTTPISTTQTIYLESKKFFEKQRT